MNNKICIQVCMFGWNYEIMGFFIVTNDNNMCSDYICGLFVVGGRKL